MLFILIAIKSKFFPRNDKTRKSQYIFVFLGGKGRNKYYNTNAYLENKFYCVFWAVGKNLQNKPC